MNNARKDVDSYGFQKESNTGNEGYFLIVYGIREILSPVYEEKKKKNTFLPYSFI